MKLTIGAAFAFAALTATGAYSASDSDTVPTPSPTMHEKATALKADKTKAEKEKAAKTSEALVIDHKTAAGFWAQAGEDGFVNSWFYFTEKKGRYVGRVVKAFKKPDAPTFSAVCEKCEGDQKDAPMIGLAIIKGMKRDGLHYEDGTIMDPRNGSTYHAKMDLSDDGEKLSVRGFLGISLFGMTQVWTRLPDDSIAAADIPPESIGPTAAKAE
jgi:uncharacterized protein (DUF2147 family)